MPHVYEGVKLIIFPVQVFGDCVGFFVYSVARFRICSRVLLWARIVSCWNRLYGYPDLAVSYLCIVLFSHCFHKQLYPNGTSVGRSDGILSLSLANSSKTVSLLYCPNW